MSRPVVAATLLVLALAGLAFALLGCGGGEKTGAARDARASVVDLGDVATRPAAERPGESISDADQAAVERQIKASSSPDAATTDDGISPGAPSDKEVRAALRKMYGGAGLVRGGSSGLIRPVRGAFTSPFGQRWGRLHAGIDLAAPTGTPIRAAASGRVILMAPTGGYGNYTCIDHGRSYSTCYAHQSRFGTERGASVVQGQVIGYVGNTGNSTGPHLHFEVRIGGRPVDPMDYL